VYKTNDAVNNEQFGVHCHLTNWFLGTSCAGGRHSMPPPPASWQYFRIYSPGGTCSGILAI